MPLYEYRCHACGKTLEVLQKFSDEPLTKHEGCGGELERLISLSSLKFKGSGWYVTDYAKGRTSPPGSNGKSESASSSTSESQSESKSESSADSKADSKSESQTESQAPSKTESKPAAAKE
jgi:putative FmdB family regulatory protein